ncbi:hypothetical protein BTVI_03850 [Pitangus sulphuratus]|nr:hypothetical protein BTVI_03850 [Pitangus sulphuratus]
MKAKFELDLATSVKDNKKSFYRYISSRRTDKENLHSLLDMGGNIVIKEEDKAEVFNTSFTLVFNSKTCCPEDSWLLELVDRDKKLNRSPVFKEETVSDLLSHLYPHKSMGPDGNHPRVMRELAEELTKLLSIIYQQSRLTGKVLDDWKLANIMPIQKKG